MKTLQNKALALAAVIALATAPAAARPRTDVTRFFISNAIARAPVAPLASDDSLRTRLYRDAVIRELDRQGFAPGGDAARYVVSTTVDRIPGPVPSRRPSISIGVGGSSGGYYGGGVGGGIGLGFGGGRQSGVTTRISVQLRERGGSTVWEGRAETQDKASADEGAIAARLASALFRDFPGVSGRTISVR